MSTFLERARRQEDLRKRAESKGSDWPKIPLGLARSCWPEIVVVVSAAQKLICSNDPISDLGGVDDALDALDIAAGER